MPYTNRSKWARAKRVHQKVLEHFPTYEEAARTMLLVWFTTRDENILWHRPPTWFSFYRAVRGYSLRTDVLDFIERHIKDKP